ncbi:MAG: SOS-induced cell division inhibitor SulA [Pseudomonas sp.]|uniref:SOS-induced cell division inhibitor SulA n=1 Tax=Pseudomonas sp. TaxID=306 RepID=UPI003391FD3F
MQLPQSLNRAQLPLFEAFLAQPVAPLLNTGAHAAWAEPDSFSELSLRGAAGHCLHLLAPILRELSQAQDARWLTLIAPPNSLTQAWLREAGLNRERILLLQARGEKSAEELACEALRLGRSHTVISWLHPLDAHSRRSLAEAAQAGGAQSLNIRLG